MFRACSLWRASANTLGQELPTLASSVKNYQVVRRFVGARSNRPYSIGAINSVVESTKGAGLAGAAAMVARAAMCVEARNSTAALADLAAVEGKISEPGLARLALGVKLTALNQLLDFKEQSLSVTGGADESEVSTLRSEVRAVHDELVRQSPGCWLVALGSAEFTLYEWKYQDAYSQLSAVETSITQYLESSAQQDVKTVASVSNTSIASLLAFKVTNQAHQAASYNTTNAAIGDTIKDLVNDPAIKADLEAFKKQLGVALSDEEAVQMAYVFEAADIRYHFHDFFPAVEKYKEWDSEEAAHVHNVLWNIYSPSPVQLPSQVLESVKNSKPLQSFYDNEDELRKLLESTPKDKDILGEIRSKFGAGPTTAMSSSDSIFHEAIAAFDKLVHVQYSPSTPEYIKNQRDAAHLLAEQLLYRTQVNMAVAMTQMDLLDEAIEVLTNVINANKYVYMWRALLARSQAYKALGKLSEASRDARMLENYRRSLTTVGPNVKN